MFKGKEEGKKNVVVDLGTNKSHMREILDLSKPTDSINNAKKIHCCNGSIFLPVPVPVPVLELT